MATLTSTRSCLKKWQYDFVEELDAAGQTYYDTLEPTDLLSMWNHVEAVAANSTCAIATDPADAAGRNVLKMTSSANAAQASLKSQQQYSANASDDASPAGAGTCCKILMHVYFDWTKAPQITKTDAFTWFKLLYAGNVDTNALVTLRLTGSGAGTDAHQFQVGFVDVGDGSANWGDGSGDTLDLDIKQTWATVLLEWQNATGGGSNGIFRCYVRSGKYYTAAEARSGTKHLEFTDLTTDNGFSQLACVARNNNILASTTTTVCFSAIAGTAGFDDATLAETEDPVIVKDMMAGMIRDVSTTAANVWIRARGGEYKSDWDADGAIRASLRYWPQSGDEETDGVETSKVDLVGLVDLGEGNYERGWWANFIRLSGLTPDTDYYARVILYDTTDDEDSVELDHTLSIKLLPTAAASMNCMHTHCAGEDGRMHPYEGFAQALAAGVRYVFFTDDHAYPDYNFKAETVDEFCHAYVHHFADQDYCLLARQAAFFYKIGDHQTRDDCRFSDRGSAATMASLGFGGYTTGVTVGDVDAAGREACFDFFYRGMEGLLTNGGAWDDTELYRVIPTGDAKHGTLFVFLNDIQFRDASSQTLLGATQKSLIKAAVLANKRPLIVLFPVRWNGPAAFYYSDNWSYSTYQGEKSEIEEWFLANCPDCKVAIFSGDRHLYEVNQRFQAGVDGRTTDVTDIFLFEWNTGSLATRQYDIDLTGEVGDPADGASTRLAQYTPGVDSGTFMRVWAHVTIDEPGKLLSATEYDADGVQLGAVSFPVNMRFGSPTTRNRPSTARGRGMFVR